ncbi:MAG: TPM domain-containing protein, partial [Bacteriovoracaceae bacterium]|nr:TPM domain-containing protein [Bacteriovoracaceae bacterium]
MFHRKILNQADLEKIKRCVEEVEKTTSGEIVPAIVPKSDFYPGALWRIAFAFSLLFTYVFYYFIDDLPFSYYMVVEILLIPVGFLVARIPFIFRLAITSRELEEEVYQRALEMFHSQGVVNTRDRSGILIFVSKLERKIIILADSGINSKIPEKFWDKIVEKMVPKIKSGKLADAFCDAIEECGEQLTKNFPIKSDDQNELPNDVVGT